MKAELEVGYSDSESESEGAGPGPGGGEGASERERKTGSEVKVAITLDKAAEFAVVPQLRAFSDDDEGKDNHQDKDEGHIRWYNGDCYSYNRPASSLPSLDLSPSNTNNSFPKSDSQEAKPRSPMPMPHILSLRPGRYTLLVRGMYEIRIFGDPMTNTNGAADGVPEIEFGLDLEVLERGSGTTCASVSTRPGGLPPPSSTEPDSSTRARTSTRHSSELSILNEHPLGIVPHILGGWFAGWGLGFTVRNVGEGWYDVESVDVVGAASEVRLRLLPSFLLPFLSSSTSLLDTNCPALSSAIHLAHRQHSSSKPSYTAPPHVSHQTPNGPSRSESYK